MVEGTIARYQVGPKIGQGGYATVWRARDTLLGRNVALKLLDEKIAASAKARRRFLHEAQTAAALDHHGIVAVYDSGETNGQVYIALSLIDGETLSERVARRLIAFDEAVRIVCAAAEALGHAHQRSVIHRDVTGRNIMLARDGRVIVLDFGLALAAWESRVTSTETTMGTAPYMAPEVMRGGEADARSDLYGLGIVLYEALTGAFPFVGEQPQAVFYAAMNLDPVPPRERRPELPPRLERVVMKAIARDPAERYQTAEEFIAALRGVTPSEPVPPPPGPVSSLESGLTSGQGADVPSAIRASRDPSRAPIYLAVLPFEAIPSSGDPEGACATLASRLAESVSGALTRASGLRVVPPPTAPLPSEMREVARQVGANLLLRGSVRRAGSQVRVDYSLLDPWRGTQVGGDVVDGSALQIFDVEDRVIASVARALEVEPPPGATTHARPADPAAHEHYLQALGYLRRYDNEASVDGAIHLLERLIASDPGIAIYYAAITRAFFHKRDRTKQQIWEGRAAAACERALALDSGRPEVSVALGEVRTRSGQYDAAVEAYTDALRQRPGYYEAMLGVASARAASGCLAEAERACREAIALQPSDWRGHDWLGRILFQGGRFAGAVEPWQRVVELTPDNSLGRRHLGSAFYRLDRFDDAVTAYRESLDIQPNDEAYTNLGAALYFLRRDDEALAALRKATELTPADPERWGNLGNACHWIPGHDAEAATALDRAIGLMRERLERNPAQPGAWARMAGWLANRARGGEAESAIRRAIELAPADVHCMVSAGRVCLELGDRKACLRWFRKAKRAGYGMEELRRGRDLAPHLGDPEFARVLGGTSRAKRVRGLPRGESHRRVRRSASGKGA